MKAPEPILIYRVYVLGMTAVYLYRCCAVSVERFNRDLTIAEQVKRGDKLVIDENVVVELAGIDVIHGYSLLIVFVLALVGRPSKPLGRGVLSLGTII